MYDVMIMRYYVIMLTELGISKDLPNCVGKIIGIFPRNWEDLKKFPIKYFIVFCNQCSIVLVSNTKSETVHTKECLETYEPSYSIKS